MTAVAMDGDEPDDEISARLLRRARVMFLRNGGATWDQVSKAVGVSEATARKDYAIVCRDINAEDPADIVARHRAVLFDVQRANYPAMMRGDKDAAATILRALEREAKLLGLDSPTKILASASLDDFANEAARLITTIAEIDSDTLKELTRGQADAAPVLDGEVVTDVDPGPAERGAGRPPAGPAVQGGEPPADDPRGSGDRDSARDDQFRGHVGSGDQDSPDADPQLPHDDLDGWSNIG